MATQIPHRQIRASFDATTVVVYQAYNRDIAAAAVAQQKLHASPQFRPGRMTWIKPSWAWMLYRAGYSYKDAGQERILALQMRHADFVRLLERAVLADRKSETGGVVRVQWDPERTVRLERLGYRSIQIGIPAALSREWTETMICGIEDVTDRARELKRVLDERPDVGEEELIRMGLVPVERPLEVPDELQRLLGMGEN